MVTTLRLRSGQVLGSANLTIDSSGVVSSQRYKPFGEVRTGSVATDLTFTGQRLENKSYVGNLMDYGARFYSPGIGRFISADTIVPGLYDPQSWNRYSYVRNNPMNRIDPSGHFDIVGFFKDVARRVQDYLDEHGDDCFKRASPLCAPPTMVLNPAMQVTVNVAEEENKPPIGVNAATEDDDDDDRRSSSSSSEEGAAGGGGPGGGDAKRKIKKVIEDPVESSEVKIHKNSHGYVGDSHVYSIKDPEGNYYKIGESAQGTRVKDGSSIRAEQQVRRLNRIDEPGYSSQIRKTFTNKKDAFDYQHKLITRYRRFGGDFVDDAENLLPGNKGGY